jgi:hypothetical protein
MEYYDSIHNEKLYNHYNQKNITMLSNDNVIEVLDRHGGLDLNNTIHLFNDEPYKLVERQVAPFDKRSALPLSMKKQNRLSTMETFDRMVSLYVLILE